MIYTLILSFFLAICTLDAHPSYQSFSKYKNKYFVETGTYRGDSVKLALDLGFQELHSIEIKPELYHYCCQRFEKNNNVHLWLGDSGEVLLEVLNKLDAPATIWLDSHYSGDDCGKGAKLTPLIDELNCIKNSHIKNHTILIDDVRLFGSAIFEGITLEQVQNIIKEINSDYKFAFEDCGNVPGVLKNDVFVAYLDKNAYPDELLRLLSDHLTDDMHILQMGTRPHLLGYPSVLSATLNPLFIDHEKTCTPAVAFSLSNPKSLPFLQHSFDAIVLFDCFHWFCNSQAIWEFDKVLKEEGILFVVDSYETSFTHILKEVCGEKMKEYTPKSKLIDNGFSVTEHQFVKRKKFCKEELLTHWQNLREWQQLSTQKKERYLPRLQAYIDQLKEPNLEQESQVHCLVASIPN